MHRHHSIGLGRCVGLLGFFVRLGHALERTRRDDALLGGRARPAVTDKLARAAGKGFDMSRLAAPIALRRLALPVFCAAALLMWLCMALAGLLAPQFERDGVRYSWLDGAAQIVWRVVIDAL